MLRAGNGNAGYLHGHFRRYVSVSVRVYRDAVLRYVLPGFERIEYDAEELANALYNNAPYNENEDPADTAERAHQEGVEFFQMMTPVRQTMVNLVAAGLFHHVEQQLAHIASDRLFANQPKLKDTKLADVQKWYVDQFDLDISALPSWPIINELRLLANLVKHSEIKKTTELRAIRPELFEQPICDDERFVNFQFSRPVTQPLAGEDLFVRKEHFEMYANAAERFFQEIGDFFKNHGNC